MCCRQEPPTRARRGIPLALFEWYEWTYDFRCTAGPRGAGRARDRDDGASAHRMDGAAPSSRATGARRADRGRRPVGAGHGLCAPARSRPQHPAGRPCAEEGREGPWVTYARMPTLRSPKDQTGPDLGLPALTFEAWYDATRGAGSFDAPLSDRERRLARLPALVSPRARPAGAQRRRRDGDRAGPARRWRPLPAGHALHRRGAGGAQARARHRAGRHRRMVDAGLRARPAGGSPRPYLRDDRLRAPARSHRRRAGRRRLGDGQCLRGARARRPRPSLLPRRRSRRSCSATAGSPSPDS